MSDIDLTDLRKTPRMLMCLYIEQVGQGYIFLIPRSSAHDSTP